MKKRKQAVGGNIGEVTTEKSIEFRKKTRLIVSKNTHFLMFTVKLL